MWYSVDCAVQGLGHEKTDTPCQDKTCAVTTDGDGVIGYLKNGELKVASEPINGEFSNETVFVTSPNALYEMKMMKGDIGEVSGFVIMSDGTEASLYNRRDKYLAPVLKRIIRLCAMLPKNVVRSQLQKSLETVIRNATQDDCSIAILAKSNGDERYYDLTDRER